MRPAEMLTRLQQMLRSRTVPVTITDREGHVLFLNEAAEALSGRSLDEVRGRRASSYFVPDDQDRVRRAGEEAASAAGAVEVDYVRVARADGEERPIAMVVANLHGDDGDHLAKLAIAVDLTHQERLTDRLRAARDELAFYADLTAHDLRNYAQTMSGYLESLLDGTLGPVTPEQERALQVCRRQTQRMSRLVYQVDLLLEGSLQEARGEPPLLTPRPLRPLLAQAAEAAARDFPDRAPTIAVHAPEEAYVKVCDRFPTALQSLVLDALDRNQRADAEVWLLAAPCPLRSAPGWRISIEDNGPGIPSEVRDWLLADARAPRRPGTGTALRVAMASLRACGGILDLEGLPHASSGASPDPPLGSGGPRGQEDRGGAGAGDEPAGPRSPSPPRSKTGTRIHLIVPAANPPGATAADLEPVDPPPAEVPR